MSRCFPYRPTLCARNGTGGGEALIETIKLHCEKDKSKTVSFKEKKRERKDKRKERKEKLVKHCGFGDGEAKKRNNGRCYQEEKNRSLCGDNLSKGIEDEEAERLEKSGLTEEHDEPVCYLSDGTHSSNKRKQPCLPTVPSITVHKNILRIRLPSLKHRETDACLSEEQAGPTVGRAADSLVRQLPVTAQPAFTNKVEEVSPVSNVLRTDNSSQLDSTACSRSAFFEEKGLGTESSYKSLIEDWVPPSFQDELNYSDDNDWLFGRKHQSQGLKRLKAGDDPCRQSSSSLWPCAHFLPEADIYALPYSIPF